MNLAYVTVKGNKPGERIAIVKQGEKGYYPAKGYDYAQNGIEQVEEFVEELNTKMGIPAAIAESAYLGSMFGWTCPAAKPANEWFARRSEMWKDAAQVATGAAKLG